MKSGCIVVHVMTQASIAYACPVKNITVKVIKILFILIVIQEETDIFLTTKIKDLIQILAVCNPNVIFVRVNVYSIQRFAFILVLLRSFANPFFNLARLKAKLTFVIRA